MFIKACVNIAPTFFAVKTQILAVNGVSGCSHASEDGVLVSWGCWCVVWSDTVEALWLCMSAGFFYLKEINFLFIIL